MGSIRISDSDGNTHVLEAIEGWRVMEGNPRAWFALHRRQRWRLRLATCHVHIAPQWAERLDPRRADQAALLDRVPRPAADLAPLLPDHWQTELDGLEPSLIGDDA